MRSVEPQLSLRAYVARQGFDCAGVERSIGIMGVLGEYIRLAGPFGAGCVSGNGALLAVVLLLPARFRMWPPSTTSQMMMANRKLSHAKATLNRARAGS
jgi:hypothetical protein